MSEGPLDSRRDDDWQSSPNAVIAAVQFLRILRRRKSCVVLMLIVAGVAGAAYYSGATRMYEAHASVLVMQTGADVWSASMSADGPRTSLIPTYERLFSSEVVLEGAMQQLSEMPAAVRVDFAMVPPERQLETLRNNLRAAAVRNTNLIEIAYRSQSPHAAAAIVDAVVQSYLSYMAANHKNVSVEIVNMLDEERLQVQQQFQDKEKELAAARSRSGDLGIREDGQQVHPAIERAVAINQRLIEVQTERLQLEASLTAIQEAVRTGGDLQQHLMAIEPVVGRDLIRSALGLGTFDQRMVPELETRLLNDRAKLQSLSEHYGPRHPLVVELRQSIDNMQQYLDNFQSNVSERTANLNNATLGPALLSIVNEKLAGVRAYEQELTRHYQEVEAEAVRLNDRFMEVSLLEHDLERLRQLHDTLLNQIANLDIRQNQADVRIAMVDEPQVDPRPVSPQLRLVLLFCLLGGCIAGAVLAYAVDLLDDRFRSPDELREELGAPVLAVIQPLESIGEGGDAVADPSSLEMEAFRTLRTTLAFAGDERNRLVVTSSEPGDGKTTVIAHLAAAYGLAGRRTLLIDADMRKPGLSRLFRMRGQPGLSDVLRSHDDLDALCAARIKASGIDGVDILPCGPKPADPLELLGRARFEELLGWAEARYEQVLIDTPPVLAASDSAVAGRLVDGVLLVIQPGKNRRRIILRAADELQLMRVPLVGIVANRVDALEEDGYEGYGYGYGYGYGEGDDDPQEDDAPSFRRAAA